MLPNHPSKMVHYFVRKLPSSEAGSIALTDSQSETRRGKHLFHENEIERTSQGLVDGDLTESFFTTVVDEEEVADDSSGSGCCFKFASRYSPKPGMRPASKVSFGILCFSFTDFSPFLAHI